MPLCQARNYEDHQLYVLKRIPFDDAAKADSEAALREANVLALLRHPHVVPYKEFFNHDGDLCLVMAHCEGGDLFHYIRGKRLVRSFLQHDSLKLVSWLFHAMQEERSGNCRRTGLAMDGSAAALTFILSLKEDFAS